MAESKFPLKNPGKIESFENGDTVFLDKIQKPTAGSLLFEDPIEGQVTLTQLNSGGAPSGPAGGDLDGTYPNPSVKAITTTSGPQSLAVSSIAGNELLARVGNNVEGIDGQFGLLGLTWIFDDGTADANPGAGKLRFDNATQSSATKWFINDTSGKLSVAAKEAMLNLSTGDWIFVGKHGHFESGKWHVFRLIGAPIETTGYVTLDVEQLDSGSDFAAGDEIGLQIVTASSESEGGGGSFTVGAWKLNASTVMADPGSRNFRLNDADQTLATAIAVSAINTNNTDVSAILGLLDSGNFLYIQELKEGDRAQLYEVTGPPTDNVSWLEIPVSHTSSGAQDIRAANDAGWIIMGGSGGGGGSGAISHTGAVRSVSFSFSTPTSFTYDTDNPAPDGAFLTRSGGEYTAQKDMKLFVTGEMSFEYNSGTNPRVLGWVSVDDGGGHSSVFGSASEAEVNYQFLQTNYVQTTAMITVDSGDKIRVYWDVTNTGAVTALGGCNRMRIMVLEDLT